ncbi:MAG: pentapeptide repeat-containing protein [Crocosphaera sp.]
MSRDALIVGINNYDYKGLKYLPSPAEDAEAIASILEQHGQFNTIRRLPEAIKTIDSTTKSPYVSKTGEVSLKQLKYSLVKLFKPKSKQISDTALFYFSGHGIRKTSGITEGFLCTSDVHPDMEFNGLSLKWLRELLQESPIKQQIIWLDCCHSGEFLNFSEANPQEVGKGRDRCFIAASREFEEALVDINSKYSVLTKLILEGLEPDQYNEKSVTTLNLSNYINEQIKQIKGNLQHPIFTNLGEPITLTYGQKIAPETPETTEKSDICPYKGLRYFELEDHHWFFGRETLTKTLLGKISQKNFLAVLGASGSGKSSVIRAGVLYQLKQGLMLQGSADWEIKIMVPGNQPMFTIAQQFLEPDLSRIERSQQLETAESLLEKGSDGLKRLIETTDAPKVLLIIDQFEEIFAPDTDKAERERFIDCLLGAVDKCNGKLKVMIAMRADFFGKCVEETYSGLSQQIEENLVSVTPMTEEELLRAITKPAKLVNLPIEPALIKEILKDIENSPGSLPLLQDALRELWKKRDHQGLTLANYTELGRVAGSLNKRATDVYQNLTVAQQLTAKHIFLNLTQLGEGTEDTRRRVLKADLVTENHYQASIDAMVQLLADEKLIVTDRTQQGDEVIDVAHEALIRHWELLRQWLDESRQQLREQRKIEGLAQEWRAQGYKNEYLLQGRRLKECRQKQQSLTLSTLALEFLDKSAKHQLISRVQAVGLFLIIPLIGTGIGLSWLFKEIQLNADKSLLENCPEKQEYCLGRQEALERLVKAGKSLAYFNLEDANLEDANLEDAKLYSANLDRANLEYANLDRANLDRAKLYNANLNNANLDRAKLYNANLINANLHNAKLDSANLHNANLYSANLDSANLERANLERAKLSGANFNNANLKDANLDSANLKDANLDFVRLNFANLKDANLDFARLNFAKLNFANLYSANLDNANLDNANLINAKNLTPAQIKLACYWDQAFYKGNYDDQKEEWIIDQEANKAYIEELKQDKASDPKNSPHCSFLE